MSEFFRLRARPPFAWAGALALVASSLAVVDRWPSTGPVVVSGLVLVLVVLVRHRAVTQQTRIDSLAAALDAETRRGALQRRVAARALEGGSVEIVCADITGLAATALGCEHAVILDLSADTRTFSIAAASGWNEGTFDSVAIDAGLDTQAGYALHTRERVAIGNADIEGRFTIPTVLRTRGVRSGLAVRMGTAVRTFGVTAVYSTATRTYSEADGEFLSGVATAVAGLYERRRLGKERADLAVRDATHRAASELASRRAIFLAQSATVLDSGLDLEATLISLARLAVPALADCAIVDLVQEDGAVRRIDVIDIDPTRRDAVNLIRRAAPNLAGEGAFARAIRTGQSVLLSDTGEEDADPVAVHERQRLTRSLRCESLLLIPLIARGQTLGLLTLGTRSVNRYGTAELSLAQELATRAAIALDNARLYREAQAASRAKDEFLATVSHELRTPINAVLGWTAMLRNHQLDSARADYACEAIERSARAQAQLLEQLLDVSRIVSGKFELRLAPVHVEGIIEAAIDTVRPIADDKKVRIGSRIERGVPLLMADPERLQQVVINLLSNAVKFSPEDGLVQVEMRRTDNAVQILVSDEGIGIKSELLPYVFDRLRQDTHSSRMNAGLGLGLWIVRDIVERHGGTVTAASAGEGKGATFVVTLPIHTAVEAAGGGARPRTPRFGQ
jgi:signal transduction histidine kinase